jgi:hypothetical protein
MESNKKEITECIDFINKTKNGDFGHVNLESISYARLEPKTIQLTKQYHYSIR